jgi:excisionase family DNA binding protein
MQGKKKITKDHKMLTEALYSVNEAAQQLRLSPWTLWDLVKRGELVRTKVAGKTFLRESELRKLIVDQVNPKRKQPRWKATASAPSSIKPR